MAQNLPVGLKELLDELDDYAPAVGCCTSSHQATCTLRLQLRSQTRRLLPFAAPQVPDELTQYALRQSGYDCQDVRT